MCTLTMGYALFSRPLASPQKLQYLLFGTPAVVAIGIGQACARPGICAFDECDVGIRENFLPGFGQNAYERVIAGVENESGNRDAIHHIGCCSTGVIIIGARETAVVCGDLVVEIA